MVERTGKEVTKASHKLGFVDTRRREATIKT